jgi:hypothetical protein
MTQAAVDQEQYETNCNRYDEEQTDLYVSGASRTACVIELAVVALARGFHELIHFRAGLERKPAFPSCWRAPGSIG